MARKLALFCLVLFCVCFVFGHFLRGRLLKGSFAKACALQRPTLLTPFPFSLVFQRKIIPAIPPEPDPKPLQQGFLLTTQSLSSLQFQRFYSYLGRCVCVCFISSLFVLFYLWCMTYRSLFVAHNPHNEQPTNEELNNLLIVKVYFFSFSQVPSKQFIILLFPETSIPNRS